MMRHQLGCWRSWKPPHQGMCLHMIIFSYLQTFYTFSVLLSGILADFSAPALVLSGSLSLEMWPQSEVCLASSGSSSPSLCLVLSLSLSLTQCLCCLLHAELAVCFGTTLGPLLHRLPFILPASLFNFKPHCVCVQCKLLQVFQSNTFWNTFTPTHSQRPIQTHKCPLTSLAGIQTMNHYNYHSMNTWNSQNWRKCSIQIK